MAQADRGAGPCPDCPAQRRVLGGHLLALAAALDRPFIVFRCVSAHAALPFNIPDAYHQHRITPRALVNPRDRSGGSTRTLKSFRTSFDSFQSRRVALPHFCTRNELTLGGVTTAARCRPAPGRSPSKYR